ncbi:gamma-aminobutyric acid receptor subunit beta-4-like [Panulirus ornatus]|uniref:gamma-aminobutyric acid receptor subunit beta-4-like n=1 Tax=Panulirus ornatus TaxID=150431 RepID=UPI003A8BA51A
MHLMESPSVENMMTSDGPNVDDVLHLPPQRHLHSSLDKCIFTNPDYTVDLYLRQRWLELRFLNNSLTRPLDLNDPILVKMLWKPEVYFPNSKDSDFQYVTLPNVMLRIHPDGTILYILRLKVTFSCMMDLASFPLDHQTCYIQLASCKSCITVTCRSTVEFLCEYVS